MNLNEMKSRLIDAASKFYNGETLLMNDREFDELESEVRSLDPEFDVKSLVLGKLEGSRISHTFHPTSVVCKSPNIPYEQLKSHSSYLIPKYDGCSIVAYYKNGNLSHILTKSGGGEGIVQTNKLKNKIIRSVHPHIQEIYYEAITSGDRSKANGLVNSKYKQDEVDRLLNLIPFGCYSTSKVVEAKFMEIYVESTVREEDYQRIMQKGLYSHSKFGDVPVDGLVSNDINSRTIKISKVYSIEEGITEIIGHRLNFSGTTGLYAPVIQIKPVYVDGATLSNVKMGPYTTIKWHKMGVGAKVKVIRRKRITPYITKVMEGSEDFSSIEKCPSCGHALFNFRSDLACCNESCPQKLRLVIDRVARVLGITREYIELYSSMHQKSFDLDILVTIFRDLFGVKTYDEITKGLGLGDLLTIFRPPRFNSRILNDSHYKEVNHPSFSLNQKIDIFVKFMRSDLQMDYIKYMKPSILYIFNYLANRLKGE